MTAAVVTLLALLILAVAAGPAMADVPASGDFSPSIWTDKADYAPGETVQLSGSNWQAGESVHIRVNDHAGSTWSRDVDVTADDAGAISDSFELPGWFVAEYSVTATGASGSTATASFTDGNVKVSVTGLTGTSTAGITQTLYNGSGCAGTAKSAPVTVAVPPTDTVGVGSSESVRLDAPATASGGQGFLSWSKPAGSNVSFTTIAGTNGQSICIAGFQSGSEDINANYSPNAAPVVTAPANQSANEGASTSFNLGSFSDAASDSPWSVDIDWGDGSSHATFNTSTTGSLGSQSHTYADGPATQTVSVKVTDKNGASATKTFTVAVANVAPTVTLAAGNPTSVNEGPTQQTYSYTISDPGADTVTAVATSCGATGVKVVGSDTNTNTTGSFQCTFADGPATSVVSASATDSDGAAGNLATQSVTVNNVAPTVSVTGPATADEGTTKTYNFTVTDPGQDTFAVDAGYPDCDAGASNNGTFAAGSLLLTATGGSFQCFFADGPSTANVKMGVRDSDGAADSSTQNVQVVAVANVDPTVTAAANQSANEGVSTAISLGSFSDPGPDSPWAVDVDWGDGSSHATFNMTLTGSLGSLNHTYADGPATRTVSVKVTDKNGGSDTKTFTVQVANVAPTVTLAAGNHLSVNEGSTHTYSYTISDPGADTVSAVHTSCGANGTKGAESNTNGSGSFECTFPDGPASSTVSASATDSDNDTGAADTQTVSVANLAPTVTFSAGNDLSVNEGSTHTYSYTISDPGQDTVQSVATSCGANGTKVAGSDSNTDTTGSFKCTFPDGPSTSVVSASAKDSDGDQGAADTQSVTINNVAPTAELGNNGPKPEGSAVTVSFTNPADPSSGDTAAGFHYGFACTAATTLPATYGDAGTSASKSCTFADNGSYVVKGRIFDRDGGYRTYDTTVTVTNVGPTITSFTGTNSLAGPLVFAPSTFKTDFTDPGTLDTHKADFAWSSGLPATQTVSPFTTGQKVDHIFAAGCNRTATVKVTDKDGDSDTKTASVNVGTGTWLPPLADQPVSDKLKNGQVLPVKVKIADCNGVSVSGLAPVIQLVKGDQTALNDDTAEVITISSVSAADTGTTMRESSGTYMYNLRVSVAQSELNQDFTIIIYPYGTSTPQTLRHVIVPVK